jgi:hypothetical protein
VEPPAVPPFPRRRAVLAAGAVLPLGRWLPASAGVPGRGGVVAVPSYRFLSAHQAAVVTEATARLVPGPLDEPAEAGHPGAREAGVTHYVDRLLSVFDVDPPAVFAGGPWSNRHAPGLDRLTDFVPLQERQERAWRSRVARLRRDVTTAVAALDKGAVAAGYSDFTAAPAAEQDRILTDLAEARDVLFGLTIDAMYSVPEYGGNAGLSAWQEIKWPGDVQPVGYPAAAVEGDDGPDPVAAGDLPAVHELLAALPTLARARGARRTRRG